MTRQNRWIRNGKKARERNSSPNWLRTRRVGSRFGFSPFQFFFLISSISRVNEEIFHDFFFSLNQIVKSKEELISNCKHADDSNKKRERLYKKLLRRFLARKATARWNIINTCICLGTPSSEKANNCLSSWPSTSRLWASESKSLREPRWIPN